MTHSVVVVTRNRVEELRTLLAALAAQTHPPDEIIVVDASDHPVPVELPGAASPRLRVQPAAPGIAAQRNAGLDLAVGDIISFFDDDALPEKEYCERVMRRFSTDSSGEIGGIGGSLNGVRSRPLAERLFRELFLLQTGNGRGRVRASGVPDPAPAARREADVSLLASTACSYRRGVLDGLRFEEYWCGGKPLGLETGRGFGEDMLFSHAVSQRSRLLLLPGARFAHSASPRNRETTEITQALYVFSLRYTSRRFRQGIAGWLARTWALTGQGLLCAMQSIRYADEGYVRGYLRAMRAPLS